MPQVGQLNRLDCSHWPSSLAKATQGLEGTLISLLRAVLKEVVHSYKHSLKHTLSLHMLANDTETWLEWLGNLLGTERKALRRSWEVQAHW